MGVMGHLIFGAYPVFAKLALAEVPKFSLLFLSTFATLLASLWLIRRHDSRPWLQIISLIFHSKALWGLVVFVIARSVTNIVSIDMTRATWVQLIYLLTPFMVAILGAMFFGEPTPRYTYRALMLSTFGAVLVLIAENDEIIPRRESELLVEALNDKECKFVTIPGASHNDLDRDPLYFQALETFFNRDLEPQTEDWPVSGPDKT